MRRVLDVSHLLESVSFAGAPAEPAEVRPRGCLLQQVQQVQQTPSLEIAQPSALARLRGAGIRLWLQDDGWSIKTSPKLVPMPRRHFFDLVENVEEVRSELQEEAKRRLQ